MAQTSKVTMMQHRKAFPEIPCTHCGKAIDKRGIASHERNCSKNPLKEGAREHAPTIQNLAYMMEVYRQGFQDGLNVKKIAA